MANMAMIMFWHPVAYSYRIHRLNNLIINHFIAVLHIGKYRKQFKYIQVH